MNSPKDVGDLTAHAIFTGTGAYNPTAMTSRFNPNLPCNVGAELQVVGFEDCLSRNPKPWYTKLVVSKSSLAKSKPRYKQILCTTVQRPTDKHGLKVRVAVNPEPAASKHR